MQTIKEKLNDMSYMRKAKADAKEEEKEEKELAKTRVQVAKEIRMAREAEAAMDLHVNKAAEKVAQHEAKCVHGSSQQDGAHNLIDVNEDPFGHSTAARNHGPTTRGNPPVAAAAGTGSTIPDYSTGAHSLI